MRSHHNRPRSVVMLLGAKVAKLTSVYIAGMLINEVGCRVAEVTGPNFGDCSVIYF